MTNNRSRKGTRIVIGIAVAVLIVIFLVVILGDGHGGPIIVIDPGEDLSERVAVTDTCDESTLKNSLPTSWQLSCGHKPPKPVDPTDPPTIPSRWLSRKGIGVIKVNGKEMMVVELVIDYNGAPRHLKIDATTKPATWSLRDDKGNWVPLRGNSKGRRLMPQDILGKLACINGKPATAADKIEIEYNKQWGLWFCN